MISSTARRSRRRVAATLSAAFLAVGSAVFGYPAVASAEPCTNTSLSDADQCCAESNGVRAPGSVCVDPVGDGIFGDLPVVGTLPGVGGVL
jgi:hypothetical protein